MRKTVNVFLQDTCILKSIKKYIILASVMDNECFQIYIYLVCLFTYRKIDNLIVRNFSFPHFKIKIKGFILKIGHICNDKVFQ